MSYIERNYDWSAYSKSIQVDSKDCFVRVTRPAPRLLRWWPATALWRRFGPKRDVPTATILKQLSDDVRAAMEAENKSLFKDAQ